MARPKVQDFLHNFRFHVVVTGFGEAGDAQLGSSAGQVPSAGFNSVTTPEVSHDAVEYREGHYIYTQKYVGIPAVADITLARGVALADGTFWAWMKSVVEGNEEYRANMSIFHFHRDSKPATGSIGDPVQSQTVVTTGIEGQIEYRCTNAFPIRHKASTDLDATASEVSIQELDMAIESFDVIDLSI